MIEQKTKIAFAMLIAAVIWVGLAMHLYGFVHGALMRDQDALRGVLVFFYYFTNLTNLLAAVSMTQWLRHEFKSYGLNPYQRRITSVVVYLLLTGLIFNLLLSHLRPSFAALRVSDAILHDVAPTLILVFWGWCIPRLQLGFMDVISWLKFPLVYFIYVLLIGNKTGRYPYPFLDVSQLGYQAVMTNALRMTACILMLSLAVLILNAFKSRVASK
jgi:hypothetical protein